jgi:hypothetical protein
MGSFWAFVLAPVPAAFLTVLLGVATPRWFSLPLFLLILWAMQLIVGLPIRWFQVRRGEVDLWRHTLAGCVMIGLPSVTYLLWHLVTAEPGNFSGALGMQVLMTVLGAMTGAFYWMLVHRRLRDGQTHLHVEELRARFD